MTFKQQEFNFLSQVPVDANDCCTKFRNCANCQYPKFPATQLIENALVVSPGRSECDPISALISCPEITNTLVYTKDGKKNYLEN